MQNKLWILSVLKYTSSVYLDCLINITQFGVQYFVDKWSSSVSWINGNVFVSEVVGLRFKSPAGQIGRSVANDSPPLRHFFERSCVVH